MMAKQDNLESQLQKAILDGLAAHPEVVFAVRTNAGMIQSIYKGKTRFIKLLPGGYPDITGMLKGGRAFFMEVKTPVAFKRKYHNLSILQQDWSNQITNGGGLWAVVCDPVSAFTQIGIWSRRING